MMHEATYLILIPKFDVGLNIYATMSTAIYLPVPAAIKLSTFIHECMYNFRFGKEIIEFVGMNPANPVALKLLHQETNINSRFTDPDQNHKMSHSNRAMQS